MSDIGFILSLPRSGSTLLLRLLNTSPDVEADGEGWLMFFALSPSLARQYRRIHRAQLDMAVKFFEDRASGEFEEFKESFVRAAFEFYRSRKGDAKIYIDKTPRYLLMTDLLVRQAPSAKVILLKRHPVHVLISIANTWEKGYWSFAYHDIDVDQCLIELSKAVDRYRDDARVHIMSYEDLVDDSELALGELGQYLEVSHVSTHLGEDSIGESPLGDKSESQQESGIATRNRRHDEMISLNWYRYAWCKRYLRKHKGHFVALGYSTGLRLELNPKSLLKGFGDLGYALIRYVQVCLER